jgi:hypothetical protein
MIRSGDRQFRLLNYVVSIPKNLKCLGLNFSTAVTDISVSVRYVLDHIQQEAQPVDQLSISKIG